jgi:hypothetical protein
LISARAIHIAVETIRAAGKFTGAGERPNHAEPRSGFGLIELLAAMALGKL